MYWPIELALNLRWSQAKQRLGGGAMQLGVGHARRLGSGHAWSPNGQDVGPIPPTAFSFPSRNVLIVFNFPVWYSCRCLQQ